MTCDAFFTHLPALLDGELLPEAAAEAEHHLATCAECAQARAKITEVRGMADAWTVETPDITERVMSAVAADDQRLLLEEMQRLRIEMQALRAEVAALRRLLPSRSDVPWTLPSRADYAKSDYARMENDPWNLIRS